METEVTRVRGKAEEMGKLPVWTPGRLPQGTFGCQGTRHRMMEQTGVQVCSLECLLSSQMPASLKSYNQLSKVTQASSDIVLVI